MRRSNFFTGVALFLCLALAVCTEKEAAGAPASDTMDNVQDGVQDTVQSSQDSGLDIVQNAALDDAEQEQMTEVCYGTIEVYNLYDAWVAPRVRQLGFAIQGRFGGYRVSIGDTVKKGQVLAALDPEPYQERIRSLEEQMENLKYNYEYNYNLNLKTMDAYKIRMEERYGWFEDEDRVWQSGEWEAVCRELGEMDEALKRLELVNEQSVETYRMEYSYLEAQLAEIKRIYGSSTITAPCAGTVVALYDMSASEYTSESMYYVAIAEEDVYCLRCESISEGYIKSARACGFRNNKQYELTYAPCDEDRLLYIKNHNETMYTDFLIMEPDQDIAYGDMALVKLVTSAKENVLLIPEITIRSDAGGKYVYRRTEEGREKVYIATGLSNGIDAEVTSGLEEGDVVYVQ